MKRLSNERYLILYPQYFDLRLSWKMGRRVPRSLAIESPSLKRLEEVCRSLGLKVIAEPDKAYPRIGNLKSGRLIVFPGTLKKEILLKQLGKALKRG
ncbi:MAG: signal recognition particle subunit SRP19/SEC65 family protein [Thermoproteota archaeon]